MGTPHPAVFICIHTLSAVAFLRDFVFITMAVWLLVWLLVHKLILAELSPPGAVPLTNSGSSSRHFDW